MKSERVAKCGQRPIGPLVQLHHHDGRAHFSNVETCGSVWTCPVCAAKITEGRREEIDTVLSAHRGAGGYAYMATLTIPHHRFQTCRELRAAVTQAWRKVKSGKAWTRVRDQYGWIGDIRALEVTHGANGWHPHIHVLIFFKPGIQKTIAEGFGGWLFDAWASAVKRLGYGQCKQSAFTYEIVDADGGAADYVGKWGAALELTKAHLKRGRGGRTPWQILADHSDSRNDIDAALFRDFGYSFKGTRQLTWSQTFKRRNGLQEPSLRELYQPVEDQTDEELAAEESIPETVVGIIQKRLFDGICRNQLTAPFLSAVEENDIAGITKMFDRNGIPWSVTGWQFSDQIDGEMYLSFTEKPLVKSPHSSADAQGSHKHGAFSGVYYQPERIRSPLDLVHSVSDAQIVLADPTAATKVQKRSVATSIVTESVRQ